MPPVPPQGLSMCHLGHSWEPRLTALLTSLLASRERRCRSYHFSEDLVLDVPEVPFAKFCGSKHIQGQPKSRGRKRDSVSSPDGRNFCKYREGKDYWGPTLEIHYHKRWTKNYG